MLNKIKRHSVSGCRFFTFTLLSVYDINKGKETALRAGNVIDQEESIRHLQACMKGIAEDMTQNMTTDKINIITADMNPFSVMSRTPVETVKSILGRIGLAYSEGLPKDAYVMAFYQALIDDPNLILRMLPGDMIDFIMDVWENDELEMDDMDWNYVEYLRIFGLLSSGFADDQEGSGRKVLYRIPEARDRFYFLFKSKKSRNLIKRYTHWDKLIAGSMFYYGVIDLEILHSIFIKVSKYAISFDEFFSYIKCRSSLWSFGAILTSGSRKHMYFQIYEVENPDLTLLYIREHKNLRHKKVSVEQLLYISESGGINNHWKGVAEFGDLVIDHMKIDYLRATVLLQKLVRMIRNSAGFDSLVKEVSSLEYHSEKEKEQMRQIIKTLYYHIPVFEYKGFNRAEYEKLFHEKQLKNREKLFTIIEGGKG